LRVTHHGLVERVIAGIQNRAEQIGQAQQRMMTGLKVEKPSDDPAVAEQILALQCRISRSEQYIRNIKNGLGSLRMTDDALSRINDILVRVRADAVEGSNQALSSQGRRALAEELDQKLRELLTIANQRYGNRYLFGGSETRQAPYQSAEGEDGWLSEITPRSGEPTTQLELIFDQGERVKVSLGGANIFNLGDGEDVFSILFDMRQALADDDPEGVGGVLQRLDEAIDRINTTNAMVGARINRAETLLERLTKLGHSLTGQVSDLADVDIVEAVTHLNEEKVSYELALRTGAKVIQPSLVNFVYL